MTRAALRVGITGHRDLPDPTAVRAGFSRILSGLLAEDPGRSLVVLSCLAEGADRLAATLAGDHSGMELEAVLPLPAADYVRDFATEASRREFAALLERANRIVVLEPRATRDAAYEAAGQHLVSHSAVLVAAWDGRPARGRGGTAGVVAYARSLGMTVHVIPVPAAR